VVASTLGNAVLLTLDGYGHTSDEDPSACIQRDVADYLIGLATPPPATVCRADRLPFEPGYRSLSGCAADEAGPLQRAKGPKALAASARRARASVAEPGKA